MPCLMAKKKKKKIRHSSRVRGSRCKEESLENAGTNTKNAEWELYPEGILG